MLLNMQQADEDADENWLLQEFGVPGSPTLADLLMFKSPTESPKAGNSNPTRAGWAPSNPQGQQLQPGLAAGSSSMMTAHRACAGGASAATDVPGAGLSGHAAAQHTSTSQAARMACANADAALAAAGYLEQQAAAALTDVQSGMQGMQILGSAAGAVPGAGAVPEPQKHTDVMPAQQEQGTACWPQQRMGAQHGRDALSVPLQDPALPAQQVQRADYMPHQNAACRPQQSMGGTPILQEQGSIYMPQHEPAARAQEGQGVAHVFGRPALQLPAEDPLTTGGIVAPAASSAGVSAHAHAPRALQVASMLAGGAWQQQDSRVRNNNSPAQQYAGAGSRASPENSSGHSSAAVLPVDVAASVAAIQAHGQLLRDQLAQRLLQGSQQQGMQGPPWSGVTADTFMGALPMRGQGAGMQQAGASTSADLAGKFGPAGFAELQARNRNAEGSAHRHADMHAGLPGHQGAGLAQHASTAFGAGPAGMAGVGFGAPGFATTSPAAGSTANSTGSVCAARGRGTDGLSDIMKTAMASCGVQPAVLNSRPVQRHASTGDLTQTSHVNRLQQQLMQQQQELQAAAADLQEQLSMTRGRARPALSEGHMGDGLSCRMARGGSVPGDVPAGNFPGMGAPGLGLNLTGQVAASGSMGALGAVLREGLQADHSANGPRAGTGAPATGAAGRPAARASPFQTMQESSGPAAAASLLQVAALPNQTEPVTPAVSSLINYVADVIRASNGHITAAVNSALPVLTAAASGGCEIGPVLKRLRITLLEAHLQAQRVQLMASMDNLSVAEQDRLAMETAELASALVSIARLDSMGAAAPLQPAGSHNAAGRLEVSTGAYLAHHVHDPAAAGRVQARVGSAHMQAAGLGMVGGGLGFGGLTGEHSAMQAAGRVPGQQGMYQQQLRTPQQSRVATPE